MNARSVSKRAYRLFCYLRAVRKREGWLRMRLAKMADRFGVTLRTVSRWVRELLDAGFLSRERRGRRASEYSILSRRNVRSNEPHIRKELTIESPSENQNHRDDAASPSEKEILELAGVPRKPANVAAIRESVSAGLSLQQIADGVALARARRMCSKDWGPVYSLRYFANAIHEAGTLARGYLDHVHEFVRRHAAA